jgi:alpha-glucosidase
MALEPVPRRFPLFSVAVLAVLAFGCSADPSPCAQAPGLIAQDTARFVAEELHDRAACKALPESMALVETQFATSEVSSEWNTRPSFSRSGDLHVATIGIEEGTSLYGTGEIAGPLLRNGKVTEVWTEQPYRAEPPFAGDFLPPFEYDDETPNLYQAHPWVLGVRADGTAFGVLADTTYRLTIDLRDGITLSSAEPFPVIIIEGPSPQYIVMRLGELTGTIDLPPLWALGYQQSRFSYTPQARVSEVADELRRRRIPCDVMWVDGAYMDRFRSFVFHPERFPDPVGLNDHLHETGFRSVFIVDPAFPIDEAYFGYQQGIEGDHFILEPDGGPFTATSWPGASHWPDYTRPETQAWWRSLIRDFLDNGIDGIWVDLNEPAIIPFGEFPTDLVHRGGGPLPEGTHARYHNVYGFLDAKATREALLEARPDERPFVLTRSNYIGGQRYAAAWTGDNAATWDHLRWSVSMALNMGLSGQPFVGPDIGGFFGIPSPELYARWIGLGALLPFSRTHTEGIVTAGDQEPWSFGEEVESLARAAIERRYRLLPYMYTLFREAALTGLPIARPVFFADPTDPALRDEDHAFLLGSDVLVEPIMTEDDSHSFARPKGIWRPFDLPGEDAELTAGLPQLYARGGAIVPAGRVVQNTTEPLLSPLNLVVSLGADGNAVGALYEDGGDGFEYRSGDYLLTTFGARRTGDTVQVSIVEQEGNRPRPGRDVVVTVLADEGVFEASGKEIDGVTIPLDAP